jgi:hypothetical protein
MAICSQCQKANFFHLPEPPQARAGDPSSLASTSSAPTFAVANNRDHLMPTAVQRPTVSPWTRPGTTEVNERRMGAAFRHQPPASQLPQPTGVAQVPLFNFPTVSRPRVTTRRANVQSQASQLVIRTKNIDMRFLICIHPQQVSSSRT